MESNATRSIDICRESIHLEGAERNEAHSHLRIRSHAEFAVGRRCHSVSHARERSTVVGGGNTHRAWALSRAAIEPVADPCDGQTLPRLFEATGEKDLSEDIGPGESEW